MFYNDLSKMVYLSIVPFLCSFRKNVLIGKIKIMHWQIKRKKNISKNNVIAWYYVIDCTICWKCLQLWVFYTRYTVFVYFFIVLILIVWCMRASSQYGYVFTDYNNYIMILCFFHEFVWLDFLENISVIKEKPSFFCLYGFWNLVFLLFKDSQ